ncbi:MAG: efflux RND transporter periplasmic adaptor subunit [Planctomycetes bacterium]|nr:efflux RND transporter periplasmic adaptor subunit [Planctomycetota bacterium]
MRKKLDEAGLALFVFIALAGFLLWLTGGLRIGWGGIRAAPESEHAHPEDAVGDRCEHGVPILACDACRFEAGAVKVDPDVERALLSTARVETRERIATLRLTGEIALDPTRVVEVAPIAPGRILEANPLLGESVEAGDLLAVLHSTALGEAKASYLDARARREIADRENERQAEMNAAIERLLGELGDRCHPAADGEARPVPAVESPIPHDLAGAWRAKLVGAASRFRAARSAFERERDLRESEISSAAAFERARQEFEAAEADYAAALAEAHLTIDLEALRAQAALANAEALLRAAESRLRVFGLDDGAIEALGRDADPRAFARLEIRAPGAGTVIAQDAAEGAVVEETDRLFTIADLSQLWIWCDLYEHDLAVVRAGLARTEPLAAEVRVAAFGGLSLAGTVDLVGSTIDPKTRTVKVRVRVTDGAGHLKPGMFATILLRIPSGERTAWVPRGAVLTDEGKSFVFQRGPDAIWLRRDVVTGARQGPLIEIAMGLSEGAEIAAGGAFMLKSDILRAKMGAG